MTREIYSSKNKGNKKEFTAFKVLGKWGKLDISFLCIVMVLLVIGIVMMFSAGYAIAVSKGYAGTYYVTRQLIFALIGLTIMFILSYWDYHFFAKKWVAFGIFGVCLVLLALVLTPLGKETDTGIKRWIGIGSFQFQPSEIMKFGVIVLFSYLISNNYDKMKKFKTGVLPYLVILGVVSALMMLEPHLSGTLLICMIGVVIIFVGGAKFTHLLALGGIGVAGIVGLVVYKTAVEGFGYFQERFQGWLDPFADPTDTSWQTCQSLIAIGSGGVFGLGLGESRQKYLYLPESQNDFVFAIVCEELGFVGAVTVILLFALFVFRGMLIASNTKDKFGMLMCVGLTIQVGIQAFLNIAVASNFIPNTGISLPFFSYGGTSLVMLLAQMGIILNISRQSNMEK
ncbi:MAG: putative lipid II flippase FtsW [Ruminococcus sp.]|nr:putative lipid II flippase FtsW [Ruminococcus sp.]